MVNVNKGNKLGDNIQLANITADGKFDMDVCVCVCDAKY